MLRAEALQLLALQLGDRLALGERLGHRLAVHLGELRLVVERLQVRRPAGHVQEDDALGLRREVQRIHDAALRPLAGFGRRVQPPAAAAAATRPAPSSPSPSDARPRNVRRASCSRLMIRIVHEHRIAIQRRRHGSSMLDCQFRVIVSFRFSSTRLTDVHAASSAGVDVLRPRRDADRDERFGRLAIGRELRAMFVQQLRAARSTLRRRRRRGPSTCRQAQSNPLVVVGSALREDRRRQRPGRFDERRIVQQHQRRASACWRSAARPCTPRGRRVERQQPRVQELPLPVHVHGRGGTGRRPSTACTRARES